MAFAASLALLLGLLCLVSTALAAGSTMPVGDLPGWTQVFANDFTVDAPLGTFSTHYPTFTPYPYPWTDTSHNYRSDPGYYYPEKTLSVANGILNVFVHYDTTLGRYLVGAVEPNTPTMTYGKFSFRLRADKVKGYKMAPLLWPNSENWPTDGEIDFPECNLDETAVGANMHFANPQGGQDAFSYPSDPVNWHVYTITWQPGSVQFAIDDVVIHTSTKQVPHNPMHLVLQFETVIQGASPPTNTQGNIQIDWVVVYQPAGSPSATVASAATSGSGAATSGGATSGPASTTGSVPAPPPPATSTYASVILHTHGIQSYWRLGEASGRALNSKSSHYSGSVSASGVKRGIPGAIVRDSNKAVKFDGVHGQIAVPAASAQIENNHMTLECWAVIYSQRASGHIAGFHDQHHADFYILQVGKTNHIEMRFRNSAGVAYTLTTAVTLGVWHHFAFTYDGVKIHAYVNGVLKQSAAASGHITSGTVPLYIGADSFGDHFAGAVDEVALYSAAITPAQVLQHYHAGRTPSSGTSVVHGVTGSGAKRQEEVEISSGVNDENGDGVIDAQDFQLALSHLTGDDVSCFEVAPLAPADENGVQHVYTLLVDSPECPPSHTAAQALMNTPTSAWQAAGFNVVSQTVVSTPTTSSGLSGGAIAGIVLASVAVALAALVVGFLIWRRAHATPADSSYAAFSEPPQ